jgi:hypothetical protein
MKRRDFLKKAGWATAGVMAAPYFLPSGRLFAPSGARLANHVVVCLFAGGVRNLESVHKAEGNLMPNILAGTESISPDIAPGMDPLPPSPLSQPLQRFGTLFKEFRFGNGPTGHYSAHTVALTGRYTTTDISLREAPRYPTLFELYRKHSTPEKAAINAWWVSNSLGPYPALNYSSFPGYGAGYGANFIQPTSLISQQGYDALGNMRTFDPNEQQSVAEIREFLDKQFKGSTQSGGVTNGSADAEALKSFISGLLANAYAGQYNNPWGAGAAMNNDMYNVFFAMEIIKQFQPELMVVNMQDVDVCHFNYTQYCNNLRKADHAVARIWDTIQNTPGMANDTVLIVVPEHGRNLQPNTVIDSYGRYALDHTSIDSAGDQMSREIFCLIVGPPGVVVQNQVISTVRGESIDIVPTVARILGFDTDIPLSAIPDGTHLYEAFV